MGAADSFFGEGKESVGHYGNGNRCSFNSWEIRRITFFTFTLYGEGKHRCVLKCGKESETRAVCGDTTEKSRK